MPRTVVDPEGAENPQGRSSQSLCLAVVEPEGLSWGLQKARCQLLPLLLLEHPSPKLCLVVPNSIWPGPQRPLLEEKDEVS